MIPAVAVASSVAGIPAALAVAPVIPLVVRHHDRGRRRARVARLASRGDDDDGLPAVLVPSQLARPALRRIAFSSSHIRVISPDIDRGGWRMDGDTSRR